MNIRQKATEIHYALLLALSIIIPSGFYKLEGIAIVLLIVSWIFVLKGYRELKTPGLSALMLWSFFGVMAAGLLYTTQLEAQWAYLGRRLAMIFVPLAFVGVRLTRRQYVGILKGFVFSSLFFISLANVYAVADSLLTGETKVLIGRSIYSKYTYYGLVRLFKDWHPTYVSLFLNISLIFCYTLFYKKKKFTLWALCSVFAILNIILLNSFIGIVAFLILTIIFAYLLFRKQKMVFVSAITAIGLLVAMNFVFNPIGFSKIEQLKKTELIITDKKEERNLLTLRLAKWKTSLQVFAKAPFIGVTNGDYRERLVEQYLENGYDYSAGEKYASHNQFLYTLVSNGIIGLLVLLALLLVPFWQHPFREYLPFVLIIGVFFLTEDILSRQQGIVFFVFFYMVLTSAIPFKTRAENV